MKLKTKILIIICISIVFIAVAGVTTYNNVRVLSSSFEKDNNAGKITRGIFELNLLTNEFLKNPLTRSLKQWNAKTNSFSMFLNEIKPLFSEELSCFEEIEQNYNRIKNLFFKLSNDISIEKGLAAIPVNDAKILLYEAKISSLSHDMMFKAQELESKARLQLKVSQKKVTLTFIVLASLFFVLIILFSMLVLTNVLNPVSLLTRGAKIVGQGNFNHKIEVSTTDEIGFLSEVFNEMSEHLKKITVNRSELEADIEKRKRVEEELRRSEEKYQTLFEKMTIGFALHEILCDNTGKPANYKFLEVNPAFEKLTGLKRDKIIGKTVLDLLPDTEQYWIENYGKVALTGDPVSFENYSRALDRHFDVTAYRPGINQFACLFLDTTARKKAEKDLFGEKERLRVTLSSIGDGVITSDLNGRVTFINKIAEELTEWTLKEAMGKNFEEVFHIINERTRKRCENPAKKAISSNSIIVLANDTVLVSRTGKEYIIADSGSPIRDVGNNIVGAVLVFRDITDKLKLETKLRQAQKMETIGTLAGGIAHDFNNILSPIIGFAEMLQEDLPLDSSEHESITQVLQAALRAKDLVRQILAFSRQSDKQFIPVKLQSIVNETLKLLKSSIPSTIDIQAKIDPDCGMVLADPTQIHQIIMNLATNAYHAMQKTGGQLKINVKATEIDSNPLGFSELLPGKYALLIVTDTGTGIRKEIMDKIFDPYFTTKKQGKGTGLGLSMVQGIVKSCNGDIHIYSEPGKGTEVHVYLPIIKKSAQDDNHDTSELVQGGTEKILVVDDEAMIVKMEQKMLERLGYIVTSRIGSIEALDLFKSDPDAFELVITDMTMPRMSGLQLTTEIRKIRPDIPVIICTGFSDQINEKNSSASGVQGYVAKPVRLKEIGKIIRDVLDAPDKGIVS